MAKNTGSGYRIGSVTNRSQVLNPRTGNFVKRNDSTGQFMGQKTGGRSYKGITHEVDHRKK